MIFVLEQGSVFVATYLGISTWTCLAGPLKKVRQWRTPYYYYSCTTSGSNRWEAKQLLSSVRVLISKRNTPYRIPCHVTLRSFILCRHTCSLMPRVASQQSIYWYFGQKKTIWHQTSGLALSYESIDECNWLYLCIWGESAKILRDIREGPELRQHNDFSQ